MKPDTPIFDEDTHMGAEPWVFNFDYSKQPGDGESVVVIAPTYAEALSEAFEERTQKHRQPIGYGGVDPSVGEVVSWIGGKLKSGAKIGAKYTMRTARAVGTAAVDTARVARYEGQKKLIERLLKDAYSRDPAKRNAARWALKKNFRELYEICSFSKPRTGPRKPPKLGILKPRVRVI